MEEEYQQTVEQLNQLKEIINIDPTNQEIISLYHDLTKLKELQEASLLEEKKKKLLNIVDNITSTSEYSTPDNNNFIDNNITSTATTTTTDTSNSKTNNESSTEIFNKHLLNAESLKEGLKCCIPLENEGHVFFLPGLITDIDNENDTCKVLLVTPINENLIPCQKYTCNMNCQRSHGIEINKGLILSHDILDTSTLKERGICFAKYEDSVWYLARIIKRIENDDTKHIKKFIVKYKGYDEYEEVTPDHIIPVCGMDIENVENEWPDSDENYSTNSDSESDSSILYSSDNESGNYNLSSSSSVNIADTLKMINDSPFGEWEKHTKGIGSLLMKKMGYEEGKGLGLDGEGIVNPIEIVIQPPGKGLDFEADEIEELAIKRQQEQEKRRLNKLKKIQRKRKLNSMESIDSDVFDFLNVSINKKAKGKLYAVESKRDSQQNDDDNQDSGNSNKGNSSNRRKSEIDSKKTKKENNLKLLQVQKQIRDLNHQIERARERYERNKVRDKVVAQHYKAKIEEFKKVLYTLELKERQVKNSRSDSKNLYSEFKF